VTCHVAIVASSPDVMIAAELCFSQSASPFTSSVRFVPSPLEDPMWSRLRRAWQSKHLLNSIEGGGFTTLLHCCDFVIGDPMYT
jgi:hypothetical protein